jgi:Protein of unknown function (DUF2752)
VIVAARVDVAARPLRLIGAAVVGSALVAPLAGVQGPACPLRSLTGVPCPFCGMTRGVTSVVHGDVGHALALNPGSVLLVVGLCLLLVWWRRPHVTFPAWAAVTVVAMLWAFELGKYATGHPL